LTEGEGGLVVNGEERFSLEKWAPRAVLTGLASDRRSGGSVYLPIEEEEMRRVLEKKDVQLSKKKRGEEGICLASDPN
jgi:hypothetical protein